MKVQIAIASAGDSLAIMSLYRWIASSQDICVSLEPVAVTDTMGSLDVINAILTQATSTATLAVTIASWLGSRREAPPIRITAGERVVIINSKSSDTVNAIIQMLEEEAGYREGDRAGRSAPIAGNDIAADMDQADEPA